MKDKIFGVPQRVGRSFMLPIAILPVAGLLLGLGSSFTNTTTIETYGLQWLLGDKTILHALLVIMNAVGSAIFDNLPLIFAVGVAIGMAKKEKEVSALSAVIAYFVMNVSINAMLKISGKILADGSIAKDVLDGTITSVCGIQSLQMGVFGGIIVGLGVAALHNRFYKIELPNALSFFGGTRFVPIISTVAYLFVGILMYFIWPTVQNGMLKHLFKEVINVDVEIPFKRMPWQEAMDRFGSDKPDTRFGMELCDVSEVVKDCGFGVFTGALENGGSVRGINVEGQAKMPRKKIDKLVEYAKGCGAKGLAYLCINEDGTYKSSFAKFMTEAELDALVAKMNGKPGDLLLFAADKNKIVWNVLGALRLMLGAELGLIDENKYNFLWVTEFPLLEWSDEENRFMAMHHPFTMPMEEDWDKIDSDPGAVRAKAYDIVLNGTELGGGSVRIHQDDIQEKMFEVLGFTKERAHEQFGFLLDAFSYGVPPHAGLAFGVDRICMHMLHTDNIKEVIAFPKVKDASDLMSEAPGTVDPKQLEELGIAVAAEEDEE